MLGRADGKARYALVVGIENPEVDVDQITPIAIEAAALVATGISIEVCRFAGRLCRRQPTVDRRRRLTPFGSQS